MPARLAWLFAAAFCLLLAAPPQQRVARAQASDAAPAEGHAAIDAEHYEFGLTLHEDTERIDGVATARVRFLSDTARAFALDLVGRDGQTGMRVAAVERVGESASSSDTLAGSDTLGFTHENNRLRIRLATPAVAGEQRTYRIRYAGVPADGLIIAENQFGDRTFFGDNWPTRARHWLPSVDHPADKATVAFDVTAPDAYQVVASGHLAERVDQPGPTTRTRYETTAPLPMKVAVIGAARFAVGYPGAGYSAGGGHPGSYAAGVPLESWVYPQSLPAGFEQMAQAGRILRFFSAHVGAFPFAKLANVESKTRYGGMENAGAIFYSENAVAEGEDIEPLIAHEIAHQWFGNAVTETSYAHLWLSEGVATYLTDLFIEETYGPERFKERMRRERRQVAEFARKNPSATLVDRQYDDATELLNPFSYQKGAWLLHMLRRRVGLETFWEGLARYYRRHAGGNANTQDFQEVMEAVSGQNLSRFFEQWAEGPALPRYEGTWRYDDGRLTVRLRQRAPEEFLYETPLEIGIYTEGGAAPRVETLRMDAREKTFTVALEEAPPRVTLDPNANTLFEAGTFEEEE